MYLEIVECDEENVLDGIGVFLQVKIFLIADFIVI